MNCRVAEPLLSAYVDGELTPVLQDRVDQHLTHCAPCQQAVCDLKAMQLALGAQALYHMAPSSLRNKVEKSLTLVKPANLLLQPVSPITLLAVIVGLALSIGATWLVWLKWPHSSKPSMTEWLVQNQKHAVDTKHLTDFQSSDPVAVTTWLQDKVRRSLSSDKLKVNGFTLVGTRVEHLADQDPLAVLIYSHDDQIIQLYLCPIHCMPASQPAIACVNGTHLTCWIDADITCWAVSSQPQEILAEFEQALKAKANK